MRPEGRAIFVQKMGMMITKSSSHSFPVHQGPSSSSGLDITNRNKMDSGYSRRARDPGEESAEVQEKKKIFIASNRQTVGQA